MNACDDGHCAHAGMLVLDAKGGVVYRDDGTARPANPEAQVVLELS